MNYYYCEGCEEELEVTLELDTKMIFCPMCGAKDSLIPNDEDDFDNEDGDIDYYYNED